MRTHLSICALLLFVAGAPAATGQTVWRCADGYREQPCADGRQVNVGDSRTREQQSQAEAAAQRDAKLGTQMEKERLRQEAQPASTYLPMPPQPSSKPVSKKKSAPAKPFTAIAPSGSKHQKLSKPKG